MSSDLSDEILERALTGRFGRYRRVYDSIDSTNLDALRWATEEGAVEGSLVVSDVQTAGRGRWGRSWVSAPGTSLLFSVVLRPRVPIDAGLLTTAAGLAVADGIQSASGLVTMLKWPNDVLVAGRKVAGILVEAHTGSLAGDAAGNAVVVGAGINLHWRRDEIPTELAEGATSIAAEVRSGRGEAGRARPDRRTKRVPARAELLAAVVNELEKLLGYLTSKGSDEIIQAAAGRSAVIGERVAVRFADGTDASGVATGIASNGGLILDGKRVVTAGEIERLRPS
ncbi:MAG: biotin--[acetyl-CoA-carboxylase] ligase [Actinomycetota bacterium]|nr:biotin--[acetyl-CoA-carboxylase] ligase [Actinomycetota bacterium]